jgi:hypothetical protein
MNKSLLTESSLARARLLATNCEITDPALPVKNAQAELAYKIDVMPQDKSQGASFDFFVDATTTLTLMSQTGTELVRAECKFRGDYVFTGAQYSPEQIAEASPLFLNQIMLLVRPHLANILSEMGFNPDFLPFSISPPGESTEKAKKKKK